MAPSRWQKKVKVGKTKRGNGLMLMVIKDAAGLPLAVHTTSANPYEVSLVETTLDKALTVGRPRRLIGDRAHESDPLIKHSLFKVSADCAASR